MHRVYRQPLVSVHSLDSCSGRPDRATRFEALVVTISFEINLLTGLLGAVPCAVDSWITASASAAVYASHKAQLQGSCSCFCTASCHDSPEAANLAKAAASRCLLIRSGGTLHLVFIFSLSRVLR